MESKTRKGIKRRSSIITIIIVIIFICIVAIFAIKISNNIENNENKDELYITNLDEEDMMQYEYSKINESLNGMYAIGIVDDNIVGVKENDEYVNIVKIDTQKEYDYCYYDTKLYILEKDNGKIQIIDLKNIEDTNSNVELNSKVESFLVYEDTIYYISENVLFKYEDGNSKEILANITSSNFVIKNDYIYIVKDKNLLKVDMDNNQEVIDDNVQELYYYDYYERDRLVYDTTIDNENIFKNIYNYYTGKITNSIKNNTYFALYGASKYVYLTSDRKNVILVEKSGENKYLYKSEDEIENINLFKEGYVGIKDSQKNIAIKLDTFEESDNINILHNIKYIK